MADYISGIERIAAPRHAVYAQLSDMRSLERIPKELASHPDASKLKIEVIDEDTCSLGVPMAGTIRLRVSERVPTELIRLETVESPLPFTLLIRLGEEGEGATTLQLTLSAELNFMFKQMIGDGLQKAVDKLAALMAAAAYA